jgi:pimeloyl-ACP methyl ester carboxylesterase
VKHRVDSGLFVREAGDGPPGRTLVHVHGLGESGLGFEELVHREELAGWRHLVPDLPGYGRSAWPAAPLTLAETADRLAGWLASPSLGPVVLLGHSMGAVVALLAAERHPGLCRALVDVEGNKSLDDCTISARAEAADEEAFVREGFGRLLDGVYRAGIDNLPLRGYYASLRLCEPRTFHRHSLELLALSRKEKLAARLAALDVPARFFGGFPHGVGPRTLELVRAEGIPSDVLAPAGHWPFLDQPEEFARRLKRFLATL